MYRTFRERDNDLDERGVPVSDRDEAKEKSGIDKDIFEK